jgi:hypothetical protein
MKLLVFSALALTLFGGVAQSEFLYQFDVNDVTGVQPFSFSLTSPALIADGASLNFGPFAVTDGTDSWTMLQGSADQPCFEFGGAAAQLATCGFAIPDSPFAGAFYVNINGGVLPNATGAYSFVGQGVFVTSSGASVSPTFTGNLAVSNTPAVPEPGSMALLSVAALAAFGTLCMRTNIRR